MDHSAPTDASQDAELLQDLGLDVAHLVLLGKGIALEDLARARMSPPTTELNGVKEAYRIAGELLNKTAEAGGLKMSLWETRKLNEHH